VNPNRHRTTRKYAVWQRLITPFTAFTILGLFAGPALAQQTPQSGTPIYGPWYDGYGWQFWWICPLMMLLMFVIVAIFVFGRRHMGDGAHHWAPPWHDSSHSALQILSERFARGDIQQDEYEQRKSAILSRR
jgi:putative membrane protein